MLGETHPLKAQTMRCIAKVYDWQGLWRVALDWGERAFAMFEIFSKSHLLDLGFLLQSISLTVWQLGEYETTLNHCLRLLRVMNEQDFDRVQRFFADALRAVSSTLAQAGRPDWAAICYEQFLLETCDTEGEEAFVHPAVCDRCFPHTDQESCIKGRRFQCQVCHDFDLCEDCHSIYQRDGIAAGSCKGHSFFMTPRASFQGKWGNPTQTPLQQLRTRLERFQTELAQPEAAGELVKDAHDQDLVRLDAFHEPVKDASDEAKTE